MKKAIITYTDKAIKKIQQLRKNKKYQEDMRHFDFWLLIVENFGVDFLMKFRNRDELRDTLEIENRQRFYSDNYFHDHALDGDKRGLRSTSLGYAWRVIYRVTKSKTEIVEIQNITEKHNYKE